MKIKEIFIIGNIPKSAKDRKPYLDRDNCQIENKTKSGNVIMLHLKRQLDGVEGTTYIRVRDRFEGITDQLLNQIFVNTDIIGLTLNQLNDFEINLGIEKTGGRLQKI